MRERVKKVRLGLKQVKVEEGREAESAAYLCGQQDGNMPGAWGEYVSVEWIYSN